MSERLNLGCGEDYRQGWTNLDAVDAVEPDIVHDLNEYPWPFDDGKFIHIEARHVLEHLNEPVLALREIARILQDNGSVRWVFPIGHTRFEDPTHQHYWTWNTPAMLAGRRKHPHEVSVPLDVIDQRATWALSSRDPLTRAYVGAKKWLDGPGSWLSQVPGLSGEVEVLFEHE